MLNEKLGLRWAAAGLALVLIMVLLSAHAALRSGFAAAAPVESKRLAACASPSFSTNTNLSAGPSPFSVTVADWNKDGKLDLISPNQTNPGTITVRLGNGDGTFAATTSSFSGAGGANPQYAVADDFNRDGKMDLALTAVDSTLIELFFGNGAGGVASTASLTVATGYSALVKGDFNNDGKTDLAAANLTNNAVSVFLGNGSGGFSAAPALSGGGTQPSALAVGDFDNDGDLDLAAANKGAANVSVYLNNGSGSFSAAVNFAAGTNPRALTAGDFNLDGKLDLAVANEGSADITVLRGAGNGSFSAAPGSPFSAGTGVDGLLSGDFNNDGKPDLAAANRSVNNVSVLLGNGGAIGNQFNPASNFSVGTGPNGLALGEFNGDGRLDLVTANLTANTNTVLLNACGGCGGLGFGNQALLSDGTAPTAILRADFNNDGKPDLATANNSSNNVAVLLGNGAGGFSPAQTTGLGVAPVALAAGDVNLDGKADLAVVSSAANSVLVLLGNGAGGFGAPVSFAVGSGPNAVAVGDLNGDGKPDLAVANRTGGNVSVLLGDGAGGFGAAANFTAGGGCVAVAIGDFNLDGKADLATANNTASSVSVLPGNGAGSFGAPLSVNFNLDPTALVVADFNLDGKLDVATANDASSNATVLLGNGNGGFGAPATYTAADGAGDLAMGDFNQDGKPDLAVGAFNTTLVTVLLNLGNGAFVKAADFSVGDAVYGVTVGDFNQDGNDDLATANRNDNNVSVRPGACCPAISATPGTLANGTAGVAYNRTLNGNGGTGPYTFALASGALPAGLTLAASGLVSGTPTVVGTFNLNIRVTDFNGCLGAQIVALTIVCPTLTVNPAPTGGVLPSGTVNAVYNQLFSQTGGVGAINFSVSAGALPPGLTLANAILSGTASAPGTFNFTITATDANNCTGARAYSITIVCQTITVGPASLPAGTAGVSYNQTFTQSGGVGLTTFSVSAGVLPTGLTLGGNGAFAGAPLQTGTFNFTVNASDVNGCTGTQAYALVVNCPTISVSPPTLTAGVNGSPYSQQFTQTGGVGAITWSLTGVVPPGLSFTAATATLAGTPTQNGGYNFTVRATDANGCFGESAYNLSVSCPAINIAPTALPGGFASVNYSQMLTQTGGNGTATWSVSAGVLPGGLTLDAASGLLAGTPLTGGTFNFTARATDTSGCFGERAYALLLNTCPAVTFTPNTLPNGTVATAYNQTLMATGAFAPVSYSLAAGTLPNGVTLSGAGLLAGTPSQTGTFNFTARAADANGCVSSKAYTLVINCAVITISPLALPQGRVNLAYAATSFSATGGLGPYTFGVTGALPAGLSLVNGTLLGTPLQAGTFNVTVTATDATSCTGTRSYVLEIRRGLVKADFDGDGKTDLSVWTPSTGNWSVLNSGNNQVQNIQWGAGFAPFNDVIVPGDYDGDGKADHAIWRGADSIWYIRKSSDGQPILQLWGTSNAPYFDIPTPGDFDGDGKTDLGVFRRDGTWFVKRSSDGGFTIVTHGQNGDTPIPADYDGDGKTDFAVFRPNAIAPAPNWFILQSSTNTVVSFQWGAGYAPFFDTPVPADYDGDGKADLAIWRGADSIWYIRPSATPNNPQLQLWGTSSAPFFDIPVPADYDGDGKADIAVFRRDGTWFVLRSSNGTFLIQTQGQQGDVPVPANGVR